MFITDQSKSSKNQVGFNLGLCDNSKNDTMRSPSFIGFQLKEPESFSAFASRANKILTIVTD